MVRGLDVFKKYFNGYPDNYVIIGGTACDVIIEDAGFLPRATKDIDVILVVEALNSDFVKQFWQFIEDGRYEHKEKSADERKYYRFLKPENREFPFQIELFSRNPDLLDFDKGSHLTPIPVDDDLSSLSAILLNDDYYQYMIEHSKIENGLHLANIEALICLKAKAYLEIKERIESGGSEDSRNLRKHKADIFRLAVMLTGEDVFELPKKIKTHMKQFIDIARVDLPDKSILKEMGVGRIEPSVILNRLMSSFPTKPLLTDVSSEVAELMRKQNPLKRKTTKSKQIILKKLNNIYIPLIQDLDIQLAKISDLFKKSSWAYFEEPKPPKYGIPVLPVYSSADEILNHFKALGEKGDDSYHHFKASYWLIDYNDKNEFSMEVSLKIYFNDTDFKVDVFIGQPFAGSTMIKMFVKLMESISLSNEKTPFDSYKDYTLYKADYNDFISNEGINKLTSQICADTLEYIKLKSNNDEQ